MLSQGAAQLASAAQVRDLRRKLAMQSTTNAKQSITPPTKTEPCNKDDSLDIDLPKAPLQIRKIDDVKKKVCFT